MKRGGHGSIGQVINGFAPKSSELVLALTNSYPIEKTRTGTEHGMASYCANRPLLFGSPTSRKWHGPPNSQHYFPSSPRVLLSHGSRKDVTSFPTIPGWLHRIHAVLRHTTPALPLIPPVSTHPLALRFVFLSSLLLLQRIRI